MADHPGRPIRLAVAGASGRLGSAIRAAAQQAGVALVAMDDAPAVIVDASHRAALTDVRAACRRHRAALIACVSDLGEDDLATLRELGREVPVVRAANLTLGHWLQTRAVRVLATATAGLPVEAAVLERHPRTKRDRPSATARVLAEAWPAGLSEVGSQRHGPQVSEHTFRLTLGPSETLTLHHDVRRLDAAAAGALLAARWAHTARPGYRSIEDVYDAMTKVRTDVHEH